MPIDGGLLFVPATWTTPANVGMDRLISTYVSMGLTPPVAVDAKNRLPTVVRN